jgi:hypothetical protein
MNDTRFKAKERGRLRTLHYEFLKHLAMFQEEHDVTQEEEKFLFSEFFLKYLVSDIEEELLQSYRGG